MTTRSGHQLLLGLGDDALGTSFCATRGIGEGADQLVLLRIFDRLALKPSEAWDLRQARRPAEKDLYHPSIGIVRGSGIDGKALWASYEYVQGYSLASVLFKSREAGIPIPADLSLLVASKVAGALTAAARVEELGHPLAHGFLVPELVVLSKEGAVRVLGFEVALALRSFDRADIATRELASYCRPGFEPRAEPRAADDIFALGSMLSALLTGTPFAAGNDSDRLAAISRARLAESGQPLPKSLAELLEVSARCRPDDGIPSSAFHESLKESILEGDYRPSYHALAVFLEKLFRESAGKDVLRTRQIPLALAREVTDGPIEEAPEHSLADADEKRLREADALFTVEEEAEAEAESVAVAGAVDAPEALESESSSFPPQVEPEPESESEDRSEPVVLGLAPDRAADETPLDDELLAGPSKSGSGRRLLVAALLAAVGLLVGGWLFSQFASRSEPHEELGRSREPGVPAAGVSTAEAAPETGPVPTFTDGAPAADLPDAVEDLEETELGLDLDAGEEADAPGLDQLAPDVVAIDPVAPAREEEDRSVAPRRTVAADALEPASSPPPPVSTPSPAPAARRPSASERSADPAPRLPAREVEDQSSRSTAPPRREAENARPEPERASIASVPLPDVAEESPAAEPVFVAPKLLQLDPPEYPLLARRAKIEGRVKMMVLVATDGSVKSVTVREGIGRAKLDEAAIAAAKKAIFAPATRDGVPVESQGEIEIQFSLD